jgi:small nuclear ribonucleoprotein B and B'
MMAGPGKGVAAGRGMPLMPPGESQLSEPAGFSAIQELMWMNRSVPVAGGISARPMPYARPPAGFPPGMMPPGFPGAPAG